MAYKKKAEWEKEFVQEIKGNIKTYGCSDEYGNTYWFFSLKNGQQRYWTNLSEESQKELGVSNGN